MANHVSVLELLAAGSKDSGVLKSVVVHISAVELIRANGVSVAVEVLDINFSQILRGEFEFGGQLSEHIVGSESVVELVGEIDVSG